MCAVPGVSSSSLPSRPKHGSVPCAKKTTSDAAMPK